MEELQRAIDALIMNYQRIEKTQQKLLELMDDVRAEIQVIRSSQNRIERDLRHNRTIGGPRR